MRKPRTWYDKGLLEDEPFLSAFKARQIAGPPTRQCTGKDDDSSITATIAKEIKDNNLLKVVQDWLDLAFQPHRADTKMRKVKVGEPGILNFFVQFYWALAQDHKLATGLLEKERRRRGYDYIFTADLKKLKLKKAHTIQERIRNNEIDEQNPQREGINDKADQFSNGAPCGQSAPKEVKAGGIPAGLKFKKRLNTKKDVPDCPERESYAPSLDLASTSSETQGTCQIELNSSILPLPREQQHSAAVCDLPKTRNKGQTNSDTRRVNHWQTNGATSDTSKLCNVSSTAISTQLANTSTKLDNKVTSFGGGDNLKPRSQASSRLKRKEDTSSPNCTPLVSARSESTIFTASSLPPNVPIPDNYNPQRGLKARPVQGKQRSRPIHGAAAIKKTRILLPQLRDVNTELRHAPNGAIDGQSFDKRTESESSQLKPQKDPASDLQSKRKHILQDCLLSADSSSEPAGGGGSAKVDTNASIFPSPLNSSVMPAIHNPSNRGRCAATSHDTRLAKKKQGSRQINGVVADKKAIDSNYRPCNVPNGLTSDQIFDNKKKRSTYAKLCFNRVSKLEQTEENLPLGSVLDPRTDDSPEGQGTFSPQIDRSLLQPSSDRSNTSAIYDPSNSRKRRSSSLDALEGDNHAVASEEVSVGRTEQAKTTGHRETKRRKIVREETMAELVKDETTAVPAHKQSWGKKGTRTKKRGPLKVESPDRFINQSETHSVMDISPINESLSHQPNQDETTSDSKRRRTSCSKDRPHKRQEVAVDQEDSVSIPVQPEPVKKRRGRPPKVKEFNQDSMQPVPRKRKMGRPTKSKVLSLAQAQLNDGTAVPLSGQNVEIKQETSISSWIPFSPVQRHDMFGTQKTVEELSRLDHIPRSLLDRSTKEETINFSENLVLAQEHGLVEEDFTSDCVTSAATENHPVDIFPTQKPPLDVMPPIWAQSRQEVCETFDWFRSYQGGVYFAHNMVKGYLLSAFSSKRDRFEHGGRLIISHGGGRAESLHTRKGQTTAQPATDQLAQDKSVRALLDNYRNQRPLVLLIDDKYVLFPYDLGARDMTYVVLGFYTIAHAWAEFQPASNEAGRVVRYKFAFRWCDDQGSPWWLIDKVACLFDSTPPSTPTSYSFEPTSKRTPTKKNKNDQGAVLRTTEVREATLSEFKSFECRLCHMGSPQVYTWSWVCLHPNCSGFWRDIKGNIPPHNLEYDFGFLKLMASLPIPPDFGKLKPDLPSCLSTVGTVTSYAFTRGFHCNSCGRLSCRFKWEKWECMNCGKCLQVSGPTHKAKDFWSNLLPIGYKDHFVSKISKIEQQPVRGFRHENGMGSIQSFILPDGRGKIHHIQPGTPSGRLEADDIFIEYQQQAAAGALKFRRWPLRSHKCRGALLTNYFSQNSGEPYQYVGGAANTVPFENAPSAVVKARALIQKRIRQTLEINVEFNEVLSAAYMERQKMAFHSDNEIGLGPVVAGLSLGSPALMHFRIHAKHDPLREKKGNLLSFVLRHGDVLVMDGASVQEYYEHTVIPNNFRIAATARQITPVHV